MRTLVLGGTSEATALARRLADAPDIEPILSLAGRTARPAPAAIPVRIGGFGGADAMAAYLAQMSIEAVVDATHPFAEQISANTRIACATAGVPLMGLGRPPWSPRDGDLWTEVDGVPAAVRALGAEPRRVFLTVGRQSLPAFATAPHHHYLARIIDPPGEAIAIPRLRLIAARGPFLPEAERALLRDERIEVIVTKNSGGEATYAKLAAARELRIPVVMIRRPPPAGAASLHGVDDVMAWLRMLTRRNEGTISPNPVA